MRVAARRACRLEPLVLPWLVALGLIPVQVLGSPPSASSLPNLTGEEIRIPVSGAVLSGRLILPEGGGPHPAAILLAGSRNSRNLPGLAEFLAGRGTAVLDLDKRGVGGSTGNWRRETFHQRTDDALAAFRFLAKHEAIDPKGIGVVGHSQGGYIAPMAAARAKDLAFVVLLAGPGQTVRDQVLTHRRITLERLGVSEEDMRRNLRRLDRQLSLASRFQSVCRFLRLSYVCGMVDHDPGPWLEAIRVPVLALFTAYDDMVPPEPNARLVHEGLARAGNPDVTVHVFPPGCHAFMPQAGPLEPMLPGYVPGFPGLVADWIEDRVASPSQE